MDIHLSPKSSLIDEKVEWFVDGLTPGKAVTIQALDVEADLESSADFKADKDGKVDPAAPKTGRGKL